MQRLSKLWRFILGKQVISWDILFKLYDTYGFPVELTKEIALLKGFDVDIKWFKKYLDQAKEKSRQATKDVFKRWIDWAKYIHWLPPTKFVWYDQLEVDDAKIIKEFEVDINWQKHKVLVFDKTPFYPEGWGQTADKWEIIIWDKKFFVYDVKKYWWVILHFVKERWWN
jgi:alanyl-tRNA synthetase